MTWRRCSRAGRGGVTCAARLSDQPASSWRRRWRELPAVGAARARLAGRAVEPPEVHGDTRLLVLDDEAPDVESYVTEQLRVNVDAPALKRRVRWTVGLHGPEPGRVFLSGPSPEGPGEHRDELVGARHQTDRDLVSLPTLEHLGETRSGRSVHRQQSTRAARQAVPRALTCATSRSRITARNSAKAPDNRPPRRANGRGPGKGGVPPMQDRPIPDGEFRSGFDKLERPRVSASP